MLSYKYDLSTMEQTKLDALIADKDMENKVVLLIDEEDVYTNDLPHYHELTNDMWLEIEIE